MTVPAAEVFEARGQLEAGALHLGRFTDRVHVCGQFRHVRVQLTPVQGVATRYLQLGKVRLLACTDDWSCINS